MILRPLTLSAPRHAQEPATCFACSRSLPPEHARGVDATLFLIAGLAGLLL